MIDTPKMIKISELPSFSIEKINTKEKQRSERNFKILNGLLVMAVLSCAFGRYEMDKNFDRKLTQQHHYLDKQEARLSELKREAFVNDNYKNPTFRKEYLSIHDELVQLKKDHCYQQTNTLNNVLFKRHGQCPECLQLRKLGIRVY